MAVSTLFNAELATVDATKSFSFTVNSGTHSENEFTVSGYAVTGGTDEACEHGAVEALYQLGYRFWTPYWTTRPSSLGAGGATIAKTQRSMPYSNMFNNYSFHPQTPNDDLGDFENWCTLNGCNDSRRPHGHAWGSWFLADETWFDANPTYTLSGSGSTRVLNLANGTAFEALAQRAASNHLLSIVQAHPYKRAAWDAPDGDTLTSDLVWPWVARCAEILRTTHGETTAELGVYAYAGHRDFVPAQGYDLTGVYAQVALGFNDLGIGYPALVAGWGALVDDVSLRGYGDIAAWDGYRIPYATGSSINFLNDYPSFIASGASGINMETSSNHIKNVLSHYSAMRVWATGGDPSSIYQTAKSELIANVFNNDSAVGDLFDYWNTETLPSKDVVRRSFDIVNGMENGSWWRTAFRRYMAVQWQLEDRGSIADDAGHYFTRMERSARWSEALWRDGGYIHSYAMARQELGSGVAVGNGRDDLYVNNSPLPHWFRYPAMPTEAEIDTAYEEALRETYFPAVAEPPSNVSDWVEVALPAPTGAAAGLSASADVQDNSKSIGVRRGVKFLFAGPGNVSFGGDVESYGAGFHLINKNYGNTTVTVSWDTGTLYLIATPSAWLDIRADGQLMWTYLPNSLRGWHLIESDTRLSIYDAEDRKDLDTRDPPFDVGYDPPQSLTLGTVCVFHQTRGRFTLSGSTPVVSPTRSKIAMPLALAQREGLA